VNDDTTDLEALPGPDAAVANERDRGGRAHPATSTRPDRSPSPLACTVASYAKPALVGAGVGTAAAFVLPGVDLGRGVLLGAVGGLLFAWIEGVRPAGGRR
jgi:hypothetical protein